MQTERHDWSMDSNKNNTQSDYSLAISELSRLEGMLDVYLNKLKGTENSQNAEKSSGVGDNSDAKMTGELAEKLALLEKKMELLDDLGVSLEKLEAVDAKLGMLEDVDEGMLSVKNLINEKLNVDFAAMYDNILDQMNVEAIKIYRNIQAVIVEENAKQNNVLFGMDNKSDGLKRRMNHVLFFCIISFLVSILVMVLQILPAFGIRLI